MLHIDLKYVSLLSNRLERFKQTGDYLWNFRCPLCGDSQRSKTKARAYLFKLDDHIQMKCHNCGANPKLDALLDVLDPLLYSEYRMDFYREHHQNNPTKQTKIQKIPDQPKEDILGKMLLRKMDCVSGLPEDHPAVEFCSKRLIPSAAIDDLYYIDGFRSIDETQKDLQPRIVFPIRNSTGKLVALSGRSIHKGGARYLSYKIDSTAQLVYNIDKVDFTETVYVLEGPFDSLFLPNSIAAIGTSFGKLKDHEHKDKMVFILDNQPRNVEVVSIYQNLISTGVKVFIWPDGIHSKDINELVMSGYPTNQLKTLIQNNTFSGLSCMAKFTYWKKT